MIKKMLLSALLTFIFTNVVVAETLNVDTAKSKVSWDLVIEPNEHVVGDIALQNSQISMTEEGISGPLVFSLNKTKSFIMEGDKKEGNDSRDSRIYSITGAEKVAPKFEIKSVSGYEPTSDLSSVTISGQLMLNGVTKEMSVKGQVEKSPTGYHFTGSHIIEWPNFNIGNPVVWILRIAKTARPNIKLTFDIYLNK